MIINEKGYWEVDYSDKNRQTLRSLLSYHYVLRKKRLFELYVLVMSRTRFRVNLHSMVA